MEDHSNNRELERFSCHPAILSCSCSKGLGLFWLVFGSGRVSSATLSNSSESHLARSPFGPAARESAAAFPSNRRSTPLVKKDLEARCPTVIERTRLDQTSRAR